MNTNTGSIYRGNWDSIRLQAVEAGEDPSDLVEIHGTEEQVQQISRAVKAQRRAANKRARASRKRNRR